MVELAAGAGAAAGVVALSWPCLALGAVGVGFDERDDEAKVRRWWHAEHGTEGAGARARASWVNDCTPDRSIVSGACVVVDGERETRRRSSLRMLLDSLVTRLSRRPAQE